MQPKATTVGINIWYGIKEGKLSQKIGWNENQPKKKKTSSISNININININIVTNPHRNRLTRKLATNARRAPPSPITLPRRLAPLMLQQHR